MAINYQSLQYFRILARYEHYTKAAEELYITQSALSKSISTLESELGIPLFERNGRNVQLTKYGRIFYDYIDRGIHELDSGIAQLREMNCPTSGKIKLAISSYPGGDIIPNMLQGFFSQYPDIKMKIYQKDAHTIAEQLNDGGIDIAICGKYFDSSANVSSLSYDELYAQELGLIVPEDSPLSELSSVSFKDVADQTFIGYNDDVSVSNVILDALEPAGFTPKINYYISDSYLISGLVRANLGIGIVPLDSHIHVNGTTLVRLKWPYLEQKYYLTWSHDRFIPAVVDTFRRYALSRAWAAD